MVDTSQQRSLDALHENWPSQPQRSGKGFHKRKQKLGVLAAMRFAALSTLACLLLVWPSMRELHCVYIYT
jgi:hypothetical protein